MFLYIFSRYFLDSLYPRAIFFQLQTINKKDTLFIIVILPRQFKMANKAELA